MNISQKQINNLKIIKKCMCVRFYISNAIIHSLFNKFPNLLNSIMTDVYNNNRISYIEYNNILYNNEYSTILLPSNLLDD
jgi:hypothetical protein